MPLARGGRHTRKVTYDSKPPVPTPRPQRSTCERLAYDLPERRMLEWTSLGLRLSNFPSFCLGLWYGSVCTSGAGLVGGGLGHAPSRSKIGGPLRVKGAESLSTKRASARPKLPLPEPTPQRPQLHQFTVPPAPETRRFAQHFPAITGF